MYLKTGGPEIFKFEKTKNYEEDKKNPGCKQESFHFDDHKVQLCT